MHIYKNPIMYHQVNNNVLIFEPGHPFLIEYLHQMMIMMMMLMMMMMMMMIPAPGTCTR